MSGRQTKYVCIHTIPNIDPEHLIEAAPQILTGVHAKFHIIYVNYSTGKVVSIFEAASKDAVHQELKRLNMPAESIIEA